MIDGRQQVRQEPYQHIDLPLGQPLLGYRIDAAAISVHLAALESETFGGAARIAEDLLEPDVEQLLQDCKVEVARSAGSGRRKNNIVALGKLREIVYAGFASNVTDTVVLAHFSDEGEMPEVDPEMRGLGNRVGNERGTERAHDQAVGGWAVGDRHHRQQRTGAGLVLHDYGRGARQEAADMPLNETRIGIDAATGRHADDQIHGLVEGSVL